MKVDPNCSACAGARLTASHHEYMAECIACKVRALARAPDWQVDAFLARIGGSVKRERMRVVIDVEIERLRVLAETSP